MIAMASRAASRFGLVGLALAVVASGTLAAPPAAHAITPPTLARKAVVKVKGLACPFCVYGLEKHLKKLPGATEVKVSLGRGEATVDFAPDSKVTEEQVRKAVRDAGFTPGAIQWSDAQDEATGRPR